MILEMIWFILILQYLMFNVVIEIIDSPILMPLLAEDMLLAMYDNADPDGLWLMLTIHAGFESVCCKEITCSK